MSMRKSYLTIGLAALAMLLAAACQDDRGHHVTSSELNSGTLAGVQERIPMPLVIRRISDGAQAVAAYITYEENIGGAQELGRGFRDGTKIVDVQFALWADGMVCRNAQADGLESLGVESAVVPPERVGSIVSRLGGALSSLPDSARIRAGMHRPVYYAFARNQDGPAAFGWIACRLPLEKGCCEEVFSEVESVWKDAVADAASSCRAQLEGLTWKVLRSDSLDLVFSTEE